MKKRIRGRVWKFGDDVDTDVMAPWSTMSDPWEERRKSVLHIRPGIVDQVQPGDPIVAGRNWGCGSSRELAPENLDLLEERQPVSTVALCTTNSTRSLAAVLGALLRIFCLRWRVLLNPAQEGLTPRRARNSVSIASEPLGRSIDHGWH